MVSIAKPTVVKVFLEPRYFFYQTGLKKCQKFVKTSISYLTIFNLFVHVLLIDSDFRHYRFSKLISKLAIANTSKEPFSKCPIINAFKS
jgi:hypothetical protein